MVGKDNADHFKDKPFPAFHLPLLGDINDVLDDVLESKVTLTRFWLAVKSARRASMVAVNTIAAAAVFDVALVNCASSSAMRCSASSSPLLGLFCQRTPPQRFKMI
jgi:hypothetical protein